MDFFDLDAHIVQLLVVRSTLKPRPQPCQGESPPCLLGSIRHLLGRSRNRWRWSPFSGIGSERKILMNSEIRLNEVSEGIFKNLDALVNKAAEDVD